jgi:hypothetical protein
MMEKAERERRKGIILNMCISKSLCVVWHLWCFYYKERESWIPIMESR